MKRFWPGLRRVLGFVPLALTCALTLKTQLWWQTTNLSFVLLPYSLWLVLLVGWTFRVFQNRTQRTTPSRQMLVFPACLAFFFVSRLTNAPLRFVFWTHQNALQRALARPIMGRQFHSKAPRIGLFRPLQIKRSNGATRFILWENEDFLSGSAVGFAHCPKRDGCSSASFSSFYWDFQSPPQTLRMNDEWIAVSVYGSDF